MNTPNILTLSRMAAAPIFVVCLLRGEPGYTLAATLLFIGASITDGIDGYLARRRGAVTDFGKLIDPLADKLLTSLAFISLVYLDLIHGLPVIIIIGRDFVVTAFRAVAGDRGVVIAASRLGKWKTGVQMGAIIGALVHLDILDGWGGQTLAQLWPQGAFLLLVNLAVMVSAALALVSGARYIRANQVALPEGTMAEGAWMLAATLGVGRLPLAPGTWGTILALLVFWMMPDPGVVAFAAFACFLALVAVPISSRAEAALGATDPGQIVIDEAAGMAIALVALPKTIEAWTIAFIFFRLFDIIKPFPANRAQHLPGGLGVVADDVVAGIQACVLTHVFVRIIL